MSAKLAKESLSAFLSAPQETTKLVKIQVKRTQFKKVLKQERQQKLQRKNNRVKQQLLKGPVMPSIQESKLEHNLKVLKKLQASEKELELHQKIADLLHRWMLNRTMDRNRTAITH